MSPTSLVVHAHFYQPPRENPWTEEVPREPSAAPFHDWNSRISAESYRPNAFARIFDADGRVLAIVNNYEELSFNIGPTLMSWLERHQPDVYGRIQEAEAGGGAIAQAWNHMILPLANERDVRTQIRWGLADFRHRFGREAPGMWMPETAVNQNVLSVLAEEGVRFTILAPGQVAAIRALEGRASRSLAAVPNRAWTPIDGDHPVDTRVAYRFVHPRKKTLGVDLVVYHGGLSHALAFEAVTSEALVDRAVSAAGRRGGLVAIGLDGETFGHHHKWADRALAYALTAEAPRRGLEVTNLASWLERNPPLYEAQVHESAWSCAHGVGRWSADCGCSTGGPAGADQKWRAPLRAALDGLRDTGVEVFERRGAGLYAGGSPWAARDAYVDVLIGAVTREDFAARWVEPGADPVLAFTLLEAQRNAMLMYTSCGWFFYDLAGLETVQVLRYAARVCDLLVEAGEPSPEPALLASLRGAHSFDQGDGRRIWGAQVAPGPGRRHPGCRPSRTGRPLRPARTGGRPPRRFRRYDGRPGSGRPPGGAGPRLAARQCPAPGRRPRRRVAGRGSGLAPHQPYPPADGSGARARGRCPAARRPGSGRSGPRGLLAGRCRRPDHVAPGHRSRALGRRARHPAGRCIRHQRRRAGVRRVVPAARGRRSIVGPGRRRAGRSPRRRRRALPQRRPVGRPGQPGTGGRRRSPHTRVALRPPGRGRDGPGPPHRAPPRGR